MKIRSILSIILASLLFVLTACAGSNDTHPTEATEAVSPTEKGAGSDTGLGDAFTRIVKSDGMQGAVLAVYGGEEVYAEGFGEALDGVPNTVDTLYGVASITKQFTAAGILQLYENKKLDLDDKLNRFFPDYAQAEKITLRQLLSQRSGIPDYSVETREEKVVAFCDGDETLSEAVTLSTDNTAAENIALIRDMVFSSDLSFTPGERFDYSDSNYGLLAAIIEKVSGMSYHDYVREHIFKPLHMMHASFIDDSADVKDAVIAQTDRVAFSEDYYAVKGAEYGCGDLLISPRELYLWYRGLFGGKIIGEASLKMMTTNYSTEEGIGYGFGLMLATVGGSEVMYHTGWIPSCSSAVFYIPDKDYCQIVSGNRSVGNPHQVAIALLNQAIERLSLS